MKTLLLFALLLAPLPAQDLAAVGVLWRIDPTTMLQQKSIEGIYIHDHRAVLGEYQNAGAWYLAGRASLGESGIAKHFFLQEAIRRNDLPSGLHPWILQTGLGFQHRTGRFYKAIVLSESSRLKTSTQSYVLSMKSEIELGHGLVLVNSFVHSDSLANKYQVGIGLDYVLWRK